MSQENFCGFTFSATTTHGDGRAALSFVTGQLRALLFCQRLRTLNSVTFAVSDRGRGGAGSGSRHRGLWLLSRGIVILFTLRLSTLVILCASVVSVLWGFRALY